MMPPLGRGAALLCGAMLLGSGCKRGAPAAEQEVGPPSAACALAGLERGAVRMVLETSEGAIHCTLDGVRAPRAAAMVVGLATGRAPFREVTSGRAVRRAYYEKMPFFRAIEDGLVQTGCPVGNGTGHPGYRIPVEVDAEDAARLGRPGALFLARYTIPPGREDPAPPPAGHVIGTQLVVGITPMSHLAGRVTVLGICEDLEVVRRIARAVARKERRVELARAVVVDGGGGVVDGGGPCPADALRGSP
jgi:peptidyl-prolyl cis-trans isomerase A (cyclophilin A)